MKKKILIVEDDTFLSSIIAEELTREGYEVKIISDGSQAIQTIRDENPDLVLLDLLMPQTDGFKVLTAIKSEPAFAKLPIVVLSNFGQAEDIRRANELGAADFLVKVNFTPKEVIAKVGKILGVPVASQ